jgi:hypothetical protein
MGSKRKANGQHPVPATETNAPIDDTSEPVTPIDYYEAVVEARRILEQIDVAERGYYRLGQLAHEVAKAGKHGDRTMAKFAEDIGIAKCVSDRYATVYKAWKGFLAPGLKSPSYAVLRELAPHASEPECQKAIRDNPDMTKRNALDLKRRLKDAEEGKAKETEETAQEAEWLRRDKKLFKDLVTLANDATRAAAFAYECTTDDQWRGFLKAIEPAQLMYVRGGGRMLVNLADLLEALLEEPETVDLAEFVAQWNRAQGERHAKAHANTQEAPTVQAS